jgi:hypothetical protein
MLPRLGLKEEAITIFGALIKQNPLDAAARNQLAKILPDDSSILESEKILEQHIEKPGTVNWNVILDSLRLLAKHGADMAKHDGLLMSTIEYAKGIDSSEAARLVASVGQRAWFNAPQLLVPMFNALDWSVVTVTPNEAFEFAQAHKFASMETADISRGEELLERALGLYELAKLTKEYEQTHYAEALVLARQYQKAITQLNVVPLEKRKAFWLQRQAEALSGLASHNAALIAIDKAIVKLEDSGLLPAFLWSKFRIRRAAADANANEDLALAIELLPSGHPFRRKLEEEQASPARHSHS